MTSPVTREAGGASERDAAKTPGQIAYEARFGEMVTGPNPIMLSWADVAAGERETWERVAARLSAALAAPAPVVPEEVRRLVDLVEELCDAFDNGASGIGDRHPAEVLKQVGPALDAAKRSIRTLAATPSRPVGDGGEASAPPAREGRDA